jgi:hypothetical protein
LLSLVARQLDPLTLALSDYYNISNKQLTYLRIKVYLETFLY